SRTGIQESQVIFFMLLSAYLFLKAQDRPWWYLGFGAALGLALLTKYTAAFLIVPLVFWLIIFDREAFRKKELYLGALLAAVIVSPVIIYNIMLFKTLGHFDFQLSYMFGQHVSYWQATPGKEIGSIVDRFVGIFQNMWFFASPVSTLIFTGALILALFRFRSYDHEARKVLVFLSLLIGFNLLLFLAISPSPRFLSMLIPWLAILAGSMLASIRTMKFRSLAIFLLALVIIWEGFFSVNSYILSRPLGREVAHYSRIHWDMHPWGFNALDRYLGALFRGRYPEYTIGYSLPWLNEIKHQALVRGRERGGEPLNALFVYNDNMSNLASLWALSRHALYDGWPFLTLQNYTETLASKGEDFYQTQGFTETYFIQNTESILLNTPERITDLGATFEASLRERSATFDTVYAEDGTAAFRVYRL
ncbi:MAG: glycosyltransferase family 39 protein, partial [Patescibacteria group bacterium]